MGFGMVVHVKWRAGAVAARSPSNVCCEVARTKKYEPPAWLPALHVDSLIFASSVPVPAQHNNMSDPNPPAAPAAPAVPAPTAAAAAAPVAPPQPQPAAPAPQPAAAVSAPAPVAPAAPAPAPVVPKQEPAAPAPAPVAAPAPASASAASRRSDAMNSLPIRAYLDQTVVPILLEGK